MRAKGRTLIAVCLVMPSLCLLVADAQDAPPGTAASPAWADGTPIVRFDQRPAEMALAADWQGMRDRRWAGPSIWTNRLQDWRVGEGMLCSVPETPLPCRTAHLLTYALEDRPGPFRLEVILTLAPDSPTGGWAGFLIGAGEGKLDYRGASLVHHTPGQGGGLLAVLETKPEGGLCFRDMTQETYPLLDGQRVIASEPVRLDYHRMMLNLEGIPRGADAYDLRLSVWAHHAGTLLGAAELCNVPAQRLLGNVALAAHSEGRVMGHRFEAFRVGGERLVAHPDRAFGPIAGTLYTVADDTLKLSAQFMSIGSEMRKYGKPDKVPRPLARLRMRPLGSTDDAEWMEAGEVQVVTPPDYCVLFRVEDWDTSQDWETEVVFEDRLEDGRNVPYAYRTVVNKDPKEKAVVSLAGFTGMGVMGQIASAKNPAPEPGQVAVGKWTPANVWMPFEDAVRAVRDHHDVDILFFMGDQVYEGKPTPPERTRMPFEDYLYKWLLWHWSFRELTNHLPAAVQPDDHDVYHGNLWGWGGRLSPTDHNASGGYICAPAFVNVVHRTQTCHLPAAYDPSPALNGISNYYCSFTYGGVGFAVLEDRKFKTPPSITEPEKQIMLGERQLQFLEEWGADRFGQCAKVVVSQTVYAAMHCDSNGALSRDPDCNGFPRVGRDRAVTAFRRAGAFVLSGDQHLGTFARLGLAAPSDAVYQFCVPAMGNIFWRWFYPATPGDAREPGAPEHLGEFLDPWGNYFRMIAVANPERRAVFDEQGSIRRRVSIPETEAGEEETERTCLGDGYGIVRFDKTARTVRVECWPHNAAAFSDDDMFPGWPIALSFDDLARPGRDLAP